VRLGEALRRDPVHAGLDFAPPHVRGADRIGAAATNSRHLDRWSGITCRDGLTHALIRTIGVCAAGPAGNALRARADERVTPLRGVKDRVCQWYEPLSTALEASQHRNGGQPSGHRAFLLVNPVLAREPARRTRDSLSVGRQTRKIGLTKAQIPKGGAGSFSRHRQAETDRRREYGPRLGSVDSTRNRRPEAGLELYSSSARTGCERSGSDEQEHGPCRKQSFGCSSHPCASWDFLEGTATWCGNP
jgi:hypothetical protein